MDYDYEVMEPSKLEEAYMEIEKLEDIIYKLYHGIELTPFEKERLKEII